MKVICPFCRVEQRDCANGGDPGPWWDDEYIPDGDCKTKCEGCGKDFIVKVDWAPSFYCVDPDFNGVAPDKG